jgi:N-acetylglucosamine-6-sulfatase
VPLPDAAPHSFFAMTDGQYAHFFPLPIERTVRRYAEAVESMDREIGRLLDRLDALGLADDTLVVYTSDNGFLFGEHGHYDKRWAWEESIRVPFLMRLPGRVPAGEEDPRLVTNLDLAPTLVTLAGLPVPAHMDGGNLLAPADGGARPWRRDFRYAYDFEPPFPVPALEAVRGERWKYVEAQGGPPRLYDLASDPGEQHDLAPRREQGGRLFELAVHLAWLRAADAQAR